MKKPFEQRYIILLILLQLGFSTSGIAGDNCQEKLSRAICIVDSPATETDRYKPHRPCVEEDTTKYTSQILAAYAFFPQIVQAALCSIQNLYIEKQFFGTAWSAPINEQVPQAMLLGLNKREMDAELRLEPFLSWFEQLSFGGAKNFSVSPYLPTTTVEPSRWKSATFLIDTLLHEAGHLLDYKNHFNKFECSSQTCKPASDSWAEIAWLSDLKPRPENDFGQRKSICINNCQANHLDPKRSADFYKRLHQSGFVTQLSAINPMEDFAETFSLYEKTHALGQNIYWHDAQGNTYNAKFVLRSNSLKQKVKFIESHLKGLE